MEATIQDSTIHYPALSTALVGMRDLRYLPAWRTRSSFYYLILSPFLTSTCLSANIDILLRVSVECHLSHTEIWGISQKTSWQISSYVDSVQCHWRIFLMQTFLSIYIPDLLIFENALWPQLPQQWLSSSHIKTNKKKQVKLILMYFIWPNVSKVLSLQYVINRKITNEIFYLLIFKSLKPGAYFTFTAYLNLDFSSEILHLSLRFTKYTVVKVESRSSCFKLVFQ